MSATILQISDCHLEDNAGQTLLGLNTDDSLSAVLALAKEKYPDADLIALTGDISNSDGAQAYPRLLKKLREEAQLNMPVVWLPGNHDDNTLMKKAVGDGFLASKSLGAWQVTCLDSSIPHEVPGRIGEPELQRSIDVLQGQPDKYHLFFCHHHLQKIGCDWLDPQVIENAGDVLKQWSNYPQLKVIAHGHVHQEQTQSFAHIDIYATPSSCIQFKPQSEDFAVGDEMPGFRVFELADDGRVSTQIYRISQRDLHIDHSAKGY